MHIIRREVFDWYSAGADSSRMCSRAHSTGLGSFAKANVEHPILFQIREYLDAVYFTQCHTFPYKAAVRIQHAFWPILFRQCISQITNSQLILTFGTLSISFARRQSAKKAANGSDTSVHRSGILESSPMSSMPTFNISMQIINHKIRSQLSK